MIPFHRYWIPIACLKRKLNWAVVTEVLAKWVFFKLLTLPACQACSPCYEGSGKVLILAQ